MLLHKVKYAIVFVLIVTLLFLQIENKSNFHSIIMIPILTVLFAKYVLGDFDLGYVYSYSDILYWIGLLSLSACIVYYYN